MPLLEIIKQIIKEKEATRIAPIHVLVIKDLGETIKDREALEKELKELEAKGLIKIGNTINDRYVVTLESSNPGEGLNVRNILK